MDESNIMTLSPSETSNYLELMEQQEDLTPSELQRMIRNSERTERARKRARRFELLDDYEVVNDEDIDEGVIELFGEEKEAEVKSLDSDEEETPKSNLFGIDWDDVNGLKEEDVPEWPDDSDDNWESNAEDWTNVFDEEEEDTESIMNYFTRRQSDWDKLCIKLDIDQRFFKLHNTQANGNCLFHSLSLAYVELTEITDDKIGFLRSMVAQTILDPNNEEAANVLKTWHMLYTMFKKEGDKEMIRHYNHMECLEGVEEEELLTDENRRKVYNAMMERNFWGEEYCLKVFERELKVKFIILNADKQKVETTNNNFDSKELVLLYYSSNHYQIVSYQDRFVFDIMNDDLGEIEEMLKENNIDIYGVKTEKEEKKVLVEEDTELIFDPLLK